MASALMRRSVLTAALAAIATVASPLATSAFAVAPALTAPTFTPANGATVAANRPQITVAYNTPLNTSASSLVVTDTSASNAVVACPVTFTSLNQNMQCTPSQTLVDGHVYKVAAHAENLDSSSKRDDSVTWTDDIPSFVSSSPTEGSTVGLINSVAMTFDEWIDSSNFTATVVKNLSNGSTTNVPAKSVSASNNGVNANPKRGTLTFTALNTFSTGDYTATFTVDGVDASIPVSPKDNPNATGTHTVHFSVNAGMPVAPPSNTSGPAEITGSNQKAVPFSGYAPLGSNVKVIVYDEETDTSSNPAKKEGTGSNDRSATTVAPADCSNSLTVNGVQECPWSLTLDASGIPDTDPNDVQASVHYQWYALTFTAAGELPSKACPSTVTNVCTADHNIDKDTTGPGTPPSVQDAYVTNDANNGTATVTVEGISDLDSDVANYILTASDTNGHSKSVPAPTPSGPGHSVGSAQFTVDNSLDDGPLTVTVTTVDSWGNQGASTDAQTKSPTSSGQTVTTYSLTKESTKTAPVQPPTGDSVNTVSGGSYSFPNLNGQSRVQTPVSASVVFDEPIRVTAKDTTSTASPQPTLFESKLCINDVTADIACVNYHQGTLTLAPNSDNRTLVWTAPAGFSLGGGGAEGHTFTISASALAATCPDKTPQNAQSYSSNNSAICERSVDPGATLTTFVLDNTAPSVHVLSVNGAPVANSSINATNIKSTTISGTTDSDTSSITLTLKSSAGSGTFLVPASAVTITPSNNSVSTWSASGLNLTTLADGLITITASGSDGANGSPIDPTAANPDGTSRSATTPMQARPTVPQGFSAVAGNGTAVLTWAAPSNNGGDALTGYTLTVSDTTAGTAAAPVSLPATPTTYTVNSLANGHAYTFALTAANDIGNGPAATTSATPKGNTAISVTGPAHGIITYGQSFGLSGYLTYAGVGIANEPVTVTTRYYNGANGPTYHGTTDQSGHWVVFGLKPAKNAVYTATFGGDGAYNGSSHSTGVQVRALVTISKVTARSKSHTSPVTLSGKVGPNFHGYRVYLYEVHGAKLVKIGSVKLSSKSTWLWTHKFSKGKHLVIAKFFGRAGNQTNQTGRVKIVRT